MMIQILSGCLSKHINNYFEIQIADLLGRVIKFENIGSINSGAVTIKTIEDEE